MEARLKSVRMARRQLYAAPGVPGRVHGSARDFLNLEPPTRPTRVAVRVTMPSLA